MLKSNNIIRIRYLSMEMKLNGSCRIMKKIEHLTGYSGRGGEKMDLLNANQNTK